MDDIVTRLRSVAQTHENQMQRDSVTLPAQSVAFHAADEIERLQNIISKQTRLMQDALTSLAGNPPSPPTIIKNAGNPL